MLHLEDVSAALARFASTGDPGDAYAASFFWDRVVQHHSLVDAGHRLVVQHHCGLGANALGGLVHDVEDSHHADFAQFHTRATIIGLHDAQAARRQAGARFILAPGCSVPDDTPKDKLKLLAQAV